MSDIYFTLAVEDRLSEAVARKILTQIDPSLHVGQCLCKGGGKEILNGQLTLCEEC